MPRYLIRRRWDRLEPDHFAQVVRDMTERAKRYDGVRWEHSHPAVDENGDLTTYCIYTSPDAETVLEHGRATGHHYIDELFEIVADLEPSESTATTRG